MFTGIVQAMGEVTTLENNQGDVTLTVVSDGFDFSDVAVGDSIAVNGICLTVVTFGDNHFTVDVSRESLRLTTLGGVKQGAKVNLEKALNLQDRLGGHLVSGHVDGLGRVVQSHHEGRSTVFKFKAPDELKKYIAAKGSVCINGVSLTVNEVSGGEFTVNLIPHTLQCTTLGMLQPGDAVNIEVDLLARYLERLLFAEQDQVTEQRLKQFGFIK